MGDAECGAPAHAGDRDTVERRAKRERGSRWGTKTGPGNVFDHRSDIAFRTPTAGGAAEDEAMSSPQVAAQDAGFAGFAGFAGVAGGEVPAYTQAAQAQIVWKETCVQVGNAGTVRVCKFALPDCYHVVRTLGEGAYGVVCHAVDSRLPDNGEAKQVAIKKIERAFEHAIDAKRAIREVKLLRQMKHDNIIALLDILPPVDLASFNDLYAVYQFMEMDLHQLIRSPQELSEDHVQYFIFQILRGIKYVHSFGVVHRDLKPANLLINGDCDLKICDFGLARAVGPADDHQSFLTEYVATRWYRAPEVLLSPGRYTKALDLWSIGCILAELLGRKVIFPGKNFQDQIEKICEVLGNPTPQDLRGVTSEQAKKYILNLPQKRAISVRQRYAPADPRSQAGQQRLLAIELLEGLLTFDPEARMSVDQAMESTFMTGLHVRLQYDPADEPVASSTIDSAWEERVASNTNTVEDRQLLRQIAYREIAHYYHGPGTACQWMPSWEQACLQTTLSSTV